MTAASLYNTIKKIFLSPIRDNIQIIIILLVTIIFIFMPIQPDVNDWELNTAGLWDDVPHLYDNQNRVYPPWGIILLIPFYLMHIAGARFFSVMTIAWLVKRREWPLYVFFLIVFTPYFKYTMYLCNMDILVLVFPMLLWEAAENKKWEWLGRGAALSILILKPQASFLLWLYLFWKNRKQIKSLLIPLLIVGLVVIPVSLIGSPPLILQWIDNLRHPSSQNQFYWLVNNVSLSTRFSPVLAVVMLSVIGGGLYLYYRKKKFTWDHYAVTASLIMISMLLSPYASRQSVIAGIAFVPTFGSLIFQYFIILIMNLLEYNALPLEPVFVTLVFITALVFYPLRKFKSARHNDKKDERMEETSPEH